MGPRLRGDDSGVGGPMMVTTLLPPELPLQFDLGAFQPFAVPEYPPPHPFRRPGDVAVLEERDRIIGDGSPHRILEVEDAGIALGSEQQISRVIISMHESSRLRQRGLHQRVEQSLQQAALVPSRTLQRIYGNAAQRVAQMERGRLPMGDRRPR